MNLIFIKKHLGDEWLKNELEKISEKDWIDGALSKENISNNPAYYVLEKIDKLIKKFESVEGFDQWAIEAKKSGKSFKHFLFELMVLDNLFSKSDEIILKISNPSNGAVPEALIKKGENSFYVEMTFLEGLPKNLLTKVNSLFNKSTKKFKDSQGIHFVGSFNFFEYEGDVRIPLPQFKLLNKLIALRYERGFGSSIMAVVPTEFVVKTTPDFKKTSLEKFFYLNAKPLKKGGLPDEFFESIFEVDEFKKI